MIDGSKIFLLLSTKHIFTGGFLIQFIVWKLLKNFNFDTHEKNNW